MKHAIRGKQKDTQANQRPTYQAACCQSPSCRCALTPKTGHFRPAHLYGGSKVSIRLTWYHLEIRRDQRQPRLKYTRFSRPASGRLINLTNREDYSIMSANSALNKVAAQGDKETLLLNTQPRPDHNRKVCLENKIIGITGANRGIGLGIAEVCLAHAASIIYSLDLFEPGAHARQGGHDVLC